VDPIAADPGKPSDAAGEPFRSLTHFGGFDWATEEHQFAVVGADGTGNQLKVTEPNAIRLAPKLRGISGLCIF
jgi:hypothetical protein